MRGKGEEAPQDFYLPLRHRCALVAAAVLTNAATVAMLVLSVMYGRQEMVEWGVVITAVTLLYCGIWLPPLFPYRLYSDRIERWELLRKVSIPLDGAVIRTIIGAYGQTCCCVIHGKKELWIRECDPWRKPLCALLRERVPAEVKTEVAPEPAWSAYRTTACEIPAGEVSFPVIAKFSTPVTVFAALFGLTYAGVILFALVEAWHTIPLILRTITVAIAATAVFFLMPVFLRMRFDAAGVETTCIISIRRILKADIETVEHRVSHLQGPPKKFVVIRTKSGKEVIFSEVMLPVPAAALHRALNRLWFESGDA